MQIRKVYSNKEGKLIEENYCLYLDEYTCMIETLSFSDYLKRVKNRDIKTINYKMISLKYWYEYIYSINMTYNDYFTLEQQLGFIEYLNNRENKRSVKDIRSIKESKYRSGFSNATINTHIENIRQYYLYLKSSYYIDLKDNELPFRKTLGIVNRKPEIKKLPEFLTTEEVNILLNNCNCIRDKLIITMMVSTGLRIGELCSLTKKAINFKKYTIELKREYLDLETGTLKTGERLLKGNKLLFMLLQRYYILERDNIAKCDNVFVTLNGNNKVKGYPLNINAVKQLFKRLRIKTGIKSCHAHALRHTFATNFISLKEKDDNVSLAMLQKLMGHKHIDTTMIYTHIDYIADEYSNSKYFEEYINKAFKNSLDY